jgi:pheganomycin biosynthesis PGM1-like protein
MIPPGPRPPIPWDLSPGGEIEEFARLKEHLAVLWAEVFPRDDAAYTSVIVPSISVPPDVLARRPGALFYEETLLFLLIRLRNPRARVVYVTSEPIPHPVMEYYLQFLAGIPVSHAVSRLTLLSAYDRSARPLTAKILERPRLVERIRAAVPDLGRAYLTVLRATSLERRLAVLLGIPLNAADPGVNPIGTLSSTRRLLREAGLTVPEGVEDLRDEGDLVDALAELRRRKKLLRRALVKLESGPWTPRAAVFTYPGAAGRSSLRRALRSLAPTDSSDAPETYLEALARLGGVVEELLEGDVHVASGQVRINPRGEVILTSSHDEIRGGDLGLSPKGCAFPADERWRLAVQEASLRVARRLAAAGVVSRLSVELLVVPEADGCTRLLGSEVNLGVGGSTHPLLAVRFLSGGRLDPQTGLFLAPSGRAKFYRATDDLVAPSYRGLSPVDLIEILTLRQLNYSAHTETGVLCYMLGGISEVGRTGLVAIGGSREQADEIFRHTVATLDREAAAQELRPQPDLDEILSLPAQIRTSPRSR